MPALEAAAAWVAGVKMAGQDGRGGADVQRWQGRLVFVAALMTWPTSLFLVVNILAAPTCYVSDDVAAAWVFIERQLPADARILATGIQGQYIPATTGRRVWVGHFDLTPNSYRRMKLANLFFSSRADERTRRQILAQANCDYVFFVGDKLRVRKELEEMLGPPVFSAPRAAIFPASSATE